MTVTVKEYDGYTLECEATGNPRPQIFWTINGRVINQGSSSVRIQESEEIGSGKVLGLSLVKSRLFLDCITRNTHQAIYGCVAFTPNDRHVAHTKLIVRPADNAPDAEAVFSQQLLESQSTKIAANSQPSLARTCSAMTNKNGTFCFYNSLSPCKKISLALKKAFSLFIPGRLKR